MKPHTDKRLLHGYILCKVHASHLLVAARIFHLASQKKKATSVFAPHLHTLGNGQVRPRGITTSQKYDRIFHTYIHKQASLPPFEV
jgi:hypothetical protein